MLEARRQLSGARSFPLCVQGSESGSAGLVSALPHGAPPQPERRGPQGQREVERVMEYACWQSTKEERRKKRPSWRRTWEGSGGVGAGSESKCLLSAVQACRPGFKSPVPTYLWAPGAPVGMWGGGLLLGRSGCQVSSRFSERPALSQDKVERDRAEHFIHVHTHHIHITHTKKN